MIILENIHKTFNPNSVLENYVLRGLSLSLDKGEFVTVIGSNGAGKSTLLNIIAGELFADKGKIYIDGKDVSNLPTAQRASFISRVFQNPLAGTCGHLTIAENMALALKRGQSRGLGKAVRKEYEKRFMQVLETLNLGLEKRLHEQIALLSGGQRQAISLLMAGLSASSLILLDEHTAALDPKTANFVLKLTQEMIEKDNLTALMVTHSMKQALDYGNRTIMLHQGEIAFNLQGESRKNAQISDLLQLFEQKKGETINDDLLLLD